MYDSNYDELSGDQPDRERMDPDTLRRAMENAAKITPRAPRVIPQE